MEDRVYVSTHVENMVVYKMYIKASSITELARKMGITIHAARTNWSEAKGPIHTKGRRAAQTERLYLINEDNHTDTRTVQPTDLRQLP